MPDTTTRPDAETGGERSLRIWSLTTGLTAGLIAAGAILLWWNRSPPPRIIMNMPGMDGRPAGLETSDNVRIGTLFEPGPGTPSTLPGIWPGFRGPDFSNVLPAPTAPLAETWPTNGPPVLWSVRMGEGCASPVVRNGRVYVLDYDETKRADMLRCLSLDDGREIWRRGYAVAIKRNHGMSRTMPAVADNCVVTIGPRGHTMGVEADTGRFLWGIDMERRYGTKIPDWYTGQCPLIDGHLAILAPCGTNVFMTAVDITTGKTVWETQPEGRWKMSHSSVAPAVIAGRRLYIYAAIGALVGVAADGADRGRILWQTPEWRASVLVPSPVVMPDGRLFVTAGYGAGGMVFQVSREGETFTVSKLRKFTPRAGLACEQHTPIFHQGRLFSILPKDAGANRSQFACADLDGNILWTSGEEQRFGIGPYLIAGDRLFILDDEGTLTMARFHTEKFIPMARAKVLPGHDSWGPLVMVGTRMLLRDFNSLACIELGNPGGAP